MTFAWTPHRFSGGALALDVANSIILRFDPARSIDRFADTAAIDDFAVAATSHCTERDLIEGIETTGTESPTRLLLMRERIDRYFRQRTLGHDDRLLLAGLMESAADALRHAQSDRSLDALTARSALRLICEPAPDRMKICGNCGWLFLDRSKNRSRAWCDMAVCGNRVKAGRHYRRRKDSPK